MLKFDNAVRSQSGKMIPLEMNGERHQCPNSEYNQQQQPQQTTQQPQPAQGQQAQPSRYETSYLIPRDDWDKVLSNLQTITAQLNRLSEYYGDLLDHVRGLSSINKREQQMADAEATYDQEKEDGTLGLV